MTDFKVFEIHYHWSLPIYYLSQNNQIIAESPTSKCSLLSTASCILLSRVLKKTLPDNDSTVIPRRATENARLEVKYICSFVSGVRITKTSQQRRTVVNVPSVRQHIRCGTDGSSVRWKMQGWKTRNWKTWTETAGMENSGKGVYGQTNVTLSIRCCSNTAYRRHVVVLDRSYNNEAFGFRRKYCLNHS